MSSQIVGRCLVCQGDIVVNPSAGDEHNKYHCDNCGIKYEFVPQNSAMIAQDDLLSKWKKELCDAVYEAIKIRDNEREERSLPLPDRIRQMDVTDVAREVTEKTKKFHRSLRKSQEEAKNTPREVSLLDRA